MARPNRFVMLSRIMPTPEISMTGPTESWSVGIRFVSDIGVRLRGLLPGIFLTNFSVNERFLGPARAPGNGQAGENAFPCPTHQRPSESIKRGEASGIE